VKYYSSVSVTVVDAHLSEGEFLEWCSQRGWNPVKIIARDPKTFVTVAVDGTLTGVDEPIVNGYWFDAKADDSGYSGLYDADSSRAHVMYSSR
jgi:hypothetical protein